MKEVTKKPIKRSKFRNKIGYLYYGSLRKLRWIKDNRIFATERNNAPLRFSYFSHKTLLRRKLRNVDMWMQENKIVNLKIAAKKVNGIVIHPGEVFSYLEAYRQANPKKRIPRRNDSAQRAVHLRSWRWSVSAFQSYLLDDCTYAANRY